MLEMKGVIWSTLNRMLSQDNEKKKFISIASGQHDPLAYIITF